MIKRRLAFIALSVALSGLAHAEDVQETDEIVRLPEQGDRKVRIEGESGGPKRFVPGGGLIASFDADRSGRIDPGELSGGVRIAFRAADRNADGALTALEQQDWAAKLPIPDQTIANPARFDPNLDHSVSEAEFITVIYQIASTYADENGGIPVTALIERVDVAPPRRLEPIDSGLKRPE